MNLVIFHQNKDALINFIHDYTGLICSQSTEYNYPGRNVVTIITDDEYCYVLADDFMDFVSIKGFNISKYEIAIGDSEEIRIRIRNEFPTGCKISKVINNIRKIEDKLHSFLTNNNSSFNDTLTDLDDMLTQLEVLTHND